METLEEPEEENEIEEVDDIEDELSWCESEPELDALPDSDNEADVSDSESVAEKDPAEEVLGRDGLLRQTTTKNTRRTPRQNIITGIPGPEGSDLAGNTPLKSFQFFFDNAMITEFVTCTNQKIENVTKDY